MIVAATLPLLLEHGDRVTTSQIAEAAGIAEGTIFRVFADKDEIIAAVIEAALDPEPLEAALAASPATSRFEDRLAAAVVIMQQRVIDIWRLVSSVGTRFHEMTRRPMADSDALVRMFDANRGQHHGRADRRRAAAPRAHAVDDAPDARRRADVAGRARAAVPARRRAARQPSVLRRLLRVAPRPVPQRALAHRRAADGADRRPRSTLPTINARIIDNGVVSRQQGLHLDVGRDHAGLHARPGRVLGRARSTGAARSR